MPKLQNLAPFQARYRTIWVHSRPTQAKRKALGGFATLQTSRYNADCVSPVSDNENGAKQQVADETAAPQLQRHKLGAW